MKRQELKRPRGYVYSGQIKENLAVEFQYVCAKLL